jgi:hypothetical protein
VIAAEGHFYTNGTFWAGAGTVAGVVGTMAVIWVTLRVGSSKRRLLYSMPVVTPLLNERQACLATSKSAAPASSLRTRRS